VERPHKREKPVGPEGEVYFGDSNPSSSENSLSPQEQLAHLVSKPIIDDEDNEKEGGNNKEKENSKREGDLGDVERLHEEEPERKSPKEQQHERYDGRREEAQRRSPTNQLRHSRRPFKRNPALDDKANNERKIFEQIRNYIKRAKITKPSPRIKRSRKTHKPKASHSQRNEIVKSVFNRKNGTGLRNDIADKNKNITTRDMFPFSDYNDIPGSTAGNFGTQFSEPYHGGQNNGNNGYSKGDYFGQDIADTQDDAAGFRLGAQNPGTSKSLVENPEEQNARHGVLLDSEKLEGFEKQNKPAAHHHERRLLLYITLT